MTLSANQQIGFPLSTTFFYPFYLYLLLRVGGDRQQSSITRESNILCRYWFLFMSNVNL